MCASSAARRHTWREHHLKSAHHGLRWRRVQLEKYEGGNTWGLGEGGVGDKRGKTHLALNVGTRAVPADTLAQQLAQQARLASTHATAPLTCDAVCTRPRLARHSCSCRVSVSSSSARPSRPSPPRRGPSGSCRYCRSSASSISPSSPASWREQTGCEWKNLARRRCSLGPREPRIAGVEAEAARTHLSEWMRETRRQH